MIELLERWGAGLTADRVERRMAVRLSQERLRLVGEDDVPRSDREEVAQLPSVRRIAELSAGPGVDRDGDVQRELHAVPPDEANLGGDDDEDDECEAAFPGEEEAGTADDEDAFYSDIWDSR